jgi:archaetidylinositol phosphate synthase
LSTSALQRSRKQRAVQETLCEAVYRPLAHLVVLALLPLRVPPPAVASAAGATGVVAALELGQGRYVLAATLIQVKTVLDNADGQLARLSNRVTVLGRYLDSELDLVVNAALFAAVAWRTGHVALAAAGFVALTAVLGINFNVERLYRIARGEQATAMPDAESLPERALRRIYLFAYAPQDKVVEWFVEWRLRNATFAARRAYHDRATVLVLANLGMSTQLAAFGLCIALGSPLAFVWVTFAEAALVALLALRRESLARTHLRLSELEEEAT